MPVQLTLRVDPPLPVVVLGGDGEVGRLIAGRTVRLFVHVTFSDGTTEDVTSDERTIFYSLNPVAVLVERGGWMTGQPTSRSRFAGIEVRYDGVSELLMFDVIPEEARPSIGATP